MFADVEGKDPSVPVGEGQSPTSTGAPDERAAPGGKRSLEGSAARPSPALEELVEVEKQSLQRIATEQRVALARTEAEIRTTEAEIELALQRERLEIHRRETENSALRSHRGMASNAGTMILAAAAGAAGIGSLFGPAGAAIGACLGVIASLALRLGADTSRLR